MVEGSEHNRAEAQRQNWFLEVNGKKTGPFTFEQIEGFLEEGEIRPYYQVTAPHLEGRWISVQELVDSVKNAGAGGLFQPPPRPAGPDHPPEPKDTDGRTDPAFSLFKALKTVQGRRSKPVPTPEPLQEVLIKPPFRIKRRTKIQLSICIALFLLTWAVLAFFKRSSIPGGLNASDQMRALRDMPPERSTDRAAQKNINSGSKLAIQPPNPVAPLPDTAREEPPQNDTRPAEAPPYVEENQQPTLEAAPPPYPPPNVIPPNQPPPGTPEENNAAAAPPSEQNPAPPVQPAPVPTATNAW